MPKGPWDELPNLYRSDADKGKSEKKEAPVVDIDITPREINYKQDAIEVGRRVLFGTIVRCCGLVSSSICCFDFITTTDTVWCFNRCCVWCCRSR